MLYLDSLRILALAVMFVVVYVTVLCVRWRIYVHLPALAPFVAGLCVFLTGQEHWFCLAVIGVPFMAFIADADAKGRIRPVISQ